MRYKSLLAIFMLCLITLIGCQSGNEGTLILGTSADYPPFEFLSGNDIVGLDIEIAEHVAESLNKKLIIKDMDFSTLIPALNAGKIDIAMAGLSVTPERKKRVDFSDVYFTVALS